MDDERSDAFVWLEKRLEIPQEFTASLMSGNDWTFIIKLHALIEAALSHVISIRLGAASLQPIMERLETSNSESGKIAFARRLGLLPSEAATFIKYLSETRNKCAHLPRTYNFKLVDHVGKMKRAQQDAWLDKVNFKVAYPLRLKPGSPDNRAEYIANPRTALFHATLTVILYLHCEWVKAEYEDLSDVVNWIAKKGPKPRYPEGFHEPSKPKPKEL